VPLSRALPVLVEPGRTPQASLARDRFLLEAVVTDPARWPAALRVYDVVGEVVSIGRWQLAPEPLPGAGVVLMRRHAGGRAAAFGSGFAGVSLVLPGREALLETAGDSLRPEQVMNRYVRGILGGLEGQSIPAVYPGRDTITARRRLLGIVGFTETRTGAVLVEALLATTGDPSTLPHLLDRADPGGVVRTAMLAPGDTTSVAAERGADATLRDLADWVARGYAERLGVAPAARALAEEESARVAELAATAPTDEAWLGARRPRAALDRRATTATMLGALDVHLAIGPHGRIGEACIAGELIAGDDTIPALEEGLRGCAPERAAVAAVVTRVLGEPRRFLLGIGPADTLVDAVMRALGG
jgi:lipoate-protein ligase A